MTDDCVPLHRGLPVSTVGVRDLARHASAIISEIEIKKEPVLVTRRGRPVVYMRPVEPAEFEHFALAHAPEFVEGMATADAELAAGETVSLIDVRSELDSDQPASAR
jgi:PHD/YefM family antitoxin component YafN of YafNO toxin-antitoxin module